MLYDPNSGSGGDVTRFHTSPFLNSCLHLIQRFGPRGIGPTKSWIVPPFDVRVIEFVFELDCFAFITVAPCETWIWFGLERVRFRCTSKQNAESFHST